MKGSGLSETVGFHPDPVGGFVYSFQSALKASQEIITFPVALERLKLYLQ